MKSNFGKLTAQLSEPEDEKLRELISILNSNIKPSVELSNEDVHIRCMYIVSEELNSYGGKFTLEELYSINELIVDSPVLIGHQKDQLPIGRNFYSEVVVKDNMHWVKSYFYWIKSSENSDNLQKNIDGGVIKECSIGFTFLTPECSICQADIRTCRHEPFRKYTIDNISLSCFYYYKQVETVLETSLVYRGAIPNTSISNELLNSENSFLTDELKELDSLSDLNEQATYLVTPRYIGLDVFINTTLKSIEIQSLDNMLVPKHILKKYFREYPKNLQNQFGQLIGFRGKERCSLNELKKFIKGETSIIKRLELKLLPSSNILKSNYLNIQLIRHRIAQKDEINKLSQEIMTKDGVRLWSLHELPPIHKGAFYQPVKVINKQDETSYTLTYDSNMNAILSLKTKDDVRVFLINKFSQNGFTIGKRYLTEKIANEDIPNINQRHNNTGLCTIISDKNNHLQFLLEGKLNYKMRLQPIILRNKNQYLLYQSE